MYNYIYEYQFLHGMPDVPEIQFLMDRYYKGLCLETQRPEYFCFDEPLSFTQASLIAPVFLIFFLHLPTIVYVTFTSIRQVTSRIVRGSLDVEPLNWLAVIFSGFQWMELPNQWMSVDVSGS